MDPNKSPSAPTPGWNPDEKSGMGQPAPPPYQDYPQYPNQQGFGPPQQGYPPMPQYGGAAPPAGVYVQQPYPPGQYQPPPGQYQPAPGQFQPAPGQYPPQASVTVQPTVFVSRGPLVNPVNDYLGYSIFTMLCCCLPLGIAALVYSISTRDGNSSGNQPAAERSSRLALKLNHAALGCGITLIIIYFILQLI
ncbi:uncharacterized protein FYW47_006056 isoform 2-T2 [Aplochiton taeniatus]